MRTLVGLYSAMHDTHVTLFIGITSEYLRAQATWKLQVGRMVLHMAAQFVAGGFANSTCWTHEIFYPVVAHNMLFQFVCRCEHLRANVTFERRYFGMGV